MGCAFGARAASSGARGTIGKPDFPIAVGGETKPSEDHISTFGGVEFLAVKGLKSGIQRAVEQVPIADVRVAPGFQSAASASKSGLRCR